MIIRCLITHFTIQIVNTMGYTSRASRFSITPKYHDGGCLYVQLYLISHYIHIKQYPHSNPIPISIITDPKRLDISTTHISHMILFSLPILDTLQKKLGWLLDISIYSKRLKDFLVPIQG